MTTDLATRPPLTILSEEEELEETELIHNLDSAATATTS